MTLSLKDCDNIRGNSKMEMREEIWKRLTQDLLIEILARLPMESIARFRAVCKSWKEMFQSAGFRKLVANTTFSSTQAFLVVKETKESTSLTSSQPLYTENLSISIESVYKFLSLSLAFLPSPVVVVGGCKNILCCWNEKDEIYLCNPLTQTWIELPQRLEDTDWDFISLAFDTCAARCILIVGRNSPEESDSTSENFMVVEMYDSKTNKWTQLEATVDNLVRPQGEGIHSHGRYYWLNELPDDGDCMSIVAFDGEHKQWNVIKGPQNITVDIFSRRPGATFVTGCDGLIVLVCTSHFSLWELTIDEVEGDKWSPFKAMDEEHELRTMMFWLEMELAHRGCTLIFVQTAGVFTVWSEDAKILEKMEFGHLFSDYWRSHYSVRPFQVNNIFWP